MDHVSDISVKVTVSICGGEAGAQFQDKAQSDLFLSSPIATSCVQNNKVVRKGYYNEVSPNRCLSYFLSYGQELYSLGKPSSKTIASLEVIWAHVSHSWLGNIQGMPRKNLWMRTEKSGDDLLILLPQKATRKSMSEHVLGVKEECKNPGSFYWKKLLLLHKPHKWFYKMFVQVENWHFMPQCWFIEPVNISEPAHVSTGVKAIFFHNQMWAFGNECHKYTNNPGGFSEIVLLT